MSSRGTSVGRVPAAADLHLALAARLAEALSESPVHRPFARRFCLALALRAYRETSWALALDLARKGLKLFPRDPELLLAIASVEHASRRSSRRRLGDDQLVVSRPRRRRPEPPAFESMDPALRESQQPRHVRELRQIAEITGGRLWRAESVAWIRDAFARVAAEVEARYLLRFEPKGPLRPGWHRLDVRVRGRKADVRARRGYYAAPPPSYCDAGR